MKVKQTLLALVALSCLNTKLSTAFGQEVIFTNSTYHVGSFPEAVTAADLNGDGKLDLIAANVLDGTLTVLTNTGSGGFGTNATVSAGASLFCVTAADVNGDGKPGFDWRKPKSQDAHGAD